MLPLQLFKLIIMSARLFYFYLVGLLSVLSCAAPLTDDARQSTNVFFDLKKFFEEEAAYLKANPVKAQKIIRYNGQEEKHQVLIKDWTKELSFFAESDINKPSWKDQYSIDSIYNGNKLLLHYKSKNKDLVTQVLDIEIVGDTVQSIVIIKNTQNQIYTSQQYLTYLPKKHYKINQIQSIIFSPEDNYSIEANYLYE